VIGEGAFGLVRKAVHARSGLERAVKIIKKGKFRLKKNYLNEM
jgi:hypothetical protein